MALCLYHSVRHWRWRINPPSLRGSWRWYKASSLSGLRSLRGSIWSRSWSLLWLGKRKNPRWPSPVGVVSLVQGTTHAPWSRAPAPAATRSGPAGCRSHRGSWSPTRWPHTSHLWKQNNTKLFRKHKKCNYNYLDAAVKTLNQRMKLYTHYATRFCLCTKPNRLNCKLLTILHQLFIGL